MSESAPEKGKLVTANGVELFCQVRGSGPAVLLIPDIPGDSGILEPLAVSLSDHYQVITFDLRGHSRSKLLPQIRKTSLTEYAEDAAALLKTLKVKNVTVFGSGMAALIALELAQNSPKLLKKVILHDPLLYNVLKEGPYKDVGWDVGNLLRTTFFRQGHAAASNVILHWEYTPEVLYSAPGWLLKRMGENSEQFVMYDFQVYAVYQPDEAKIAAIKTPVVVLFSTSSYAWRRPMAAWLAERLHTSAQPFLGDHAPYIRYAPETAEALKLHIDQ